MSDNPAPSHPVVHGAPTELGHYSMESIPDDIIGGIFLHSLPAHGSVQPSGHSFPLVLAQICAHWRHVALGTVQLWSSVDLTLRASSSDASNPGIIQLLHTWFRRAKAHPLSLTVRCPHGHTDWPFGLLELIKAYAPQFSSLALSMPSAHWEQVVRDNESFPSLRHFSLNLAIEGRVLPTIEAFPALDRIPQLEELRIHSDCDFPSLRLRSKTITTLELMGPTRFAQIEDSFPNLRNLTLRHASVKAVLIPPPSSALPLESLCVNTALFLDMVTFPHLRHLDIKLRSFQCVELLCAFISRSGCTLLDLKLRIIEQFHDSVLIDVFKITPCVTSLIVDMRGNYNEGWRTIFSVLKSTKLLPALRDLSMMEILDGSEHKTEAYNHDAVASMLCARVGQTELKSFSLALHPTNFLIYKDSTNPLTPEAFVPYGAPAGEMMRLREEGLDVGVQVNFTGIPTMYWPLRGEDNQVPFEFPACECPQWGNRLR